VRRNGTRLRDRRYTARKGSDPETTEAYGYVVKPFRPEDVHVAIQLALERRSRETRES
jgi:hypothetical protein